MIGLRRRWVIILVAAPIGLLVGAYLWRAWSEAQNIVHPVRKPIERSLTEFGIESEDVEFVTSDGLVLRGWYVPPDTPSRAVVISQPGYANRRTRVITHTAFLADHGYGVLTFDWRATGQSDGDTATVGLYETRDVAAARDWLRERDDIDQDRVGALGQSAGAAAILMAAADDPSIAAVVAETPFASHTSMMNASVEQKTGLPGYLFAPAIMFFARIETGASMSQVRPVDSIGQIAPRPVLLIRGGADLWVPPQNADLLYEAAGEPKFLWDAPGADHSRVYRAHPLEYERRVIEFFDRYLKLQPEPVSMGPHSIAVTPAWPQTSRDR